MSIHQNEILNDFMWHFAKMFAQNETMFMLEYVIIDGKGEADDGKGTKNGKGVETLEPILGHYIISSVVRDCGDGYIS